MAASIWTPGTQSTPSLPAVAPVQFVKGTAALPGITFVGDIDTGVWSQADGFINFTCNGVNVLTIDPSGNVTVNKLVTAPELDVASAATVDIGAVLSNTLRITGIANISSFGTTYRGPIFVRFAGALILSHSASLILPGGAAITTAIGDTCVVTPKATAGVSDGWEVISYQRASFAPPISGYAVAGANTDITSLSGVVSINGGQLAGMRNRIINGSMQIAQRASLVYTTGISGYSGPDRYVSANIGAGGQFTQAAGTMTVNGQSLPAIVQTVNVVNTNITVGNYWQGVTQQIEGFNCFDLKTKPIAVSFWFNASVAGNYTVALRDGGAINTFLATIVALANTPQKVTVLIPATLATGVMPNSNAVGLYLSIGAINTGTFQSAVVGSWTVGNFLVASGSTNWGATLNATISITELQVEGGTVATVFERRIHGTELAMCQRYFETGTYSWIMYQAAGSGFSSVQPYSVAKRVAPTVSASGVSSANVTSPGVATSGVTGLVQSGTATALGTVVHTGTYIANAEL